MCETYDLALTYSGMASEVVGCKKAAIVVVFFLYIINSIVTGLIYLLEIRKKDNENAMKMVKAMKGFKADIEQRSFFFFAFALLIQIVAPVPVGVVFLYLYLLSCVFLFFAHLKSDKPKLRVIAIFVQFILCVVVIFIVLIDPWCRHYYYRYVVGVPPDDYFTKSTSYIPSKVLIISIYSL